MEVGVESSVVKSEEAAEDDDAWLYGSHEAEQQLHSSGAPNSKTSSGIQSNLSPDATVFQPKQQSELMAEAADGIASNHMAQVASADNAEVTGGENTQDKNNDSDGGDEDSEDDDDDDIQVTIGDIKTTYDAANKYKPPYQRSSAPGGSGSKPPGKGIDMDAVGNINGVPVYEFDIDGLKVEDKPWRKPGADITDYFNYGFNEDTWTKYCEKQRRLRMDNSVNKSGGNLIFVQGSSGTVQRSDRSQPVDIPGTGQKNMSYDLQRGSGPPPSMHKPSGTIDVIGSSARETLRPLHDFRNSERKPDLPPQQPMVPASNIITVPMSSVPLPPHLNIPPPDFALPPPGSLQSLPPPPGTLHGPPPPHIGHPPPGLIGPPLVVGPPPPGYPAPPPQVVRVPVDAFGRPLAPPPPERRPPPNFVERPPFSFDQFGRPIFAPPTSAPPPVWEQRPPGGSAPAPINVVVGGGPVPSTGAPRSQRLSPLRSDTEFSSSDDDADQKLHIKTEPLDKERERDEYRRREKSRSDEVRRSRDNDRRDYDRDRDRVRSTRETDRDRRDRSRDRDRGDKRGRERDERHHSKRKEDDSRHHSKHKKIKKVKEEPHDEADNAIPTIKSER